MSDKLKIEVEFSGDAGSITSNVKLNDDVRRAIIDSVVAFVKERDEEPKDDQGEPGPELVESCDEEDAVSLVNMYRALLVHALQCTDDEDDRAAFLQTAIEAIKNFDPKFFVFFHGTFAKDIED